MKWLPYCWSNDCTSPHALPASPTAHALGEQEPSSHRGTKVLQVGLACAGLLPAMSCLAIYTAILLCLKRCRCQHAKRTRVGAQQRSEFTVLFHFTVMVSPKCLLKCKNTQSIRHQINDATVERGSEIVILSFNRIAIVGQAFWQAWSCFGFLAAAAPWAAITLRI